MVAEVSACRTQKARRAAAEKARKAAAAAAAAAQAAAAQAQAAAAATAARQQTLNSCNPNVDMNTLIRLADSTKGQCFVLYAAISQFDQSTGPCSFRADFDNHADGDWYSYPGNNGIFSAEDSVNCPTFDQFSDEQIARVWAVSTGTITYDTQIGGSTTANEFTVLQIERA
jgi:hypothetical protein